MAKFDLPEDAFREIGLRDPDLFNDVSSLTSDLLDQAGFSILMVLLVLAWFVLVPEFALAPRLDRERLEAAFDLQYQRVSTIGFSDPEGFIGGVFASCAQPALLEVLCAKLEQLVEGLPEKGRPDKHARMVMFLAMQAVLTELDRAQRG